MTLVLFRTFFAQFFTSETVTSDDELRRMIFWTLAFLLVPGLLLIVHVFFDYQGIVLRAIRYQRFDVLDDTLEWIAFLFVTYSMVTVGFLAACVWDSLAFDRRDAMVLGPLPLRSATVITAKVAALGAFLLAVSGPVTLLNAGVFAVATGDRLGTAAVVRHFEALIAATLGAAVFVFAAMVATRGAVGLLAGPRVAAALGTLLQFVFVVALLGIVILCPAVWRVPHRALVNPTATGWLPTSWFLGLFEHLRGSTRVYFEPLAARAVMASAIVIACAAATSIVGFPRQMQRALSASAAPALGGARIMRRLARALLRGDRVATATSDFMLLTLARNRAQATPIAMNTAVGIALVLAGLSRVRSFSSAAELRSVALSAPLVLAYWTTVGLRASFFVPSELPAAWALQSNGPLASNAYRRGARAATIAVVGPAAALLAAVTAGLVGGWSAGIRHGALVLLAVVALAEATVMTIGFVPFTRAYEPGHAKLKTRWPLYLVGSYVFSYGLVGGELATWHSATGSLLLFATIGLGIVALEMAGRRLDPWSVNPPEEVADDARDVAVLGIGGVIHRAHVGG